ncbi:unnamed protein product, partial [Phaeothamnion confervicola]
TALQHLKAGQRLIGSVVEARQFGAFLDCSVARPGSGGKMVPVNALLHRRDVTNEFALTDTPKATRPGITEIRKGETGMHVQVYEKDEYENTGR